MLLHMFNSQQHILMCKQHFPNPGINPHDLDIIRIACLLFNTLESINIPCSVKAFGSFLRPPQLEVAYCDFKSRNSSSLSLNIKSDGKRMIFRATAWFNTRVSTPYSSARSSSSITLWSRITYILLITTSSGKATAAVAINKDS